MNRNQLIFQFFDWYCEPAEGLWNRFANEIPRLLALGVTDVWLPPAYKGTRGARSEGYDVYDLYDLGEFFQKDTVATKYGTRDEYISAVRKARDAGLKVCVDVVLNHMGGAEEMESITVRKVDAADRTQFISEAYTTEAYTRFTFPGRGKTYSDFVWNFQCFTGIDHIPGEEEPAIYSICNDWGEGWEEMADNENGNFDFLLMNDIEMRNPAVREELKRWGKWYFDTIGFDGVRLDAVKHISPAFFNEWLDYMRSEVNPQLSVIGEYWLSDDLSVLLKYINATERRMKLFDAPLHRNLHLASTHRGEFDLQTIFENTLTDAEPQLAVTFVDNHDTQPLQSLEEFVEPWFRPHAYALVLLRERGLPCVFYPDIYGSSYCGAGKRSEARTVTIEPLAELPLLCRLRADAAYGEQHDYFDHPGCVGWTRSGDTDFYNSGLAVLISNHPDQRLEKRMYVGSMHAGRNMISTIGELKDTIVIDDEGFGDFAVEASGLGLWQFA